MYDKMNGIGAHEVIIETPEHSKSRWRNVGEADRRSAVGVQGAGHRSQEGPRFRYILLFKNHGDAAGASLEHPHSQLIALPVIPKRVQGGGGRRAPILRIQGALHLLRHHPPGSGQRGCAWSAKRSVSRDLAVCAALSLRDVDPAQAARSHFEDADAATLQNLAWILRSTLRKIEKVLENPAFNFIVHSAPVQEAPLALLPLACRDHSQIDKSGGLRMGDGILHQSDTSGRVGEVPARGGVGVEGLRRVSVSGITADRPTPERLGCTCPRRIKIGFQEQ